MNRMVEDWELGSILVTLDHETVPHHCYWIITSIAGKEIELAAYNTMDDRYLENVGWFSKDELDSLKLKFKKIYPTRLAKKIYPNAKEEDGWLIIENL